MKLMALLLLFSLAYANCANLIGTWVGIYHDHDPYDRTLPITIVLNESHGIISGKLLSTRFLNMTIQGKCYKDKTILYFLNPNLKYCGNVASLAQLTKRHLDIHLHWQNAMTGGNGLASLSRKSLRTIGSQPWKSLETCF
jgi:hypothetical protein